MQLDAADLLDIPNMSRYLASFRRYAKGSPTLWGLRNYGDVNRRRTTYTKPGRLTSSGPTGCQVDAVPGAQ